MFAEPRIVPDQVGNEGVKRRSDRNREQDQCAVDNDEESNYLGGVGPPAVFAGLRYRDKRAADSAKRDHEPEHHEGEQQQQINRIELADPRMKGTSSAAEPGVVVLIGLQPLMHEGSHHVQCDQGQKSIQQENAIGASYGAAKVKSSAAPARVVEPKPE